MKWQLINHIGENPTQTKNVEKLLSVILQKYDENIPKGPPLGYKPIIIETKTDMGHMVSWKTSEENYTLYINGTGDEIDKVAFQFARGIGHIYCDPRINNWFVEVLCHVSSLFYLDYLVDIWEEHGLDSTFGNNYEDFVTYKNFLISGSFSGVDLVQYQVSNKWIKNEVQKLIGNQGIVDRDRVILVAIEILPLFKMFDNAWSLLPFVGKSSPPETYDKPKGYMPIVNSKPDFNKLQIMLPDDLKAIYLKLKSKILS